MPGMNGQGSRGPGGGRCRSGQGQGQGRGMGGKGRFSGGRGMGGQGQGMGQGRRMGGQGMNAGNTLNNTQGNTMNSVKKVAVTSEGPTLDSRVDGRFGRAGGFAIVDLETMNVEYVDNGSSQAMSQGAGIQAAENVANAGAQVVLSGYVGPKAFAALKAAGIDVGQDVENMTVGEAVAKFKAGEVAMADSANAQAGGK